MTAPATRGPRPRVFIGLIEIGGYYVNLASGLAAAGVPATFVDLERHPFGYGGGSSHPLVRLAREARARRVEAGGGASLALWRALYGVALVALLAWAAARHDVFVFSFRTTFLRLRDLALLRRLGKTVVMVFHGSDARPPYVDGADMDPTMARTIADCAALAATKRADIARLERGADVIVAYPTYAQFFSRPIVDFQLVGIPQPLLREFPSVTPEPPSPPIRILHAPSNPFVKGSARIRDVVAELVAEGLRLELVELRGVPNSAVQEALAECHFVVDQLYSDIPVTGFVAEAARHGRPAVLGGYGWEEISRLMPDAPTAPVELCHPDGLASAIRRLATDEVHRRALGAAARRFAETWSAEAVAARFAELMSGRVPEAWLRDLDAARYTHGVGLAEDAARGTVAALIAEHGPGALQLDHRPRLREAFRAFASGAAPDADREGPTL